MEPATIQPQERIHRSNNFIYDQNLIIRDVVYWKDFKYLNPVVVRTNRKQVFGANIKPCKRFFRIWLEELAKGVKHLFHEGSLHGIKYIVDPSFSRKEKVTWIVIMVISVAICFANIIQLFLQWTSTPFVNVMDALPTPVWAVPFPSVVLCPHLHLKLSYANVSELNEQERFFASLICPKMIKMSKALSEQLRPEDNKKLQDFINQASPKCTEVVRGCFWRPTDDQEWLTKECCDILFRPIFTNYGRCYAFNRLPLNGMTNDTIQWQKGYDQRVSSRPLIWGLDEGYPRVFPPDPVMKPLRAMASGEINGLGIELYFNTSEHQFGCDEASIGYTVLIGSPTDHVYTSTVLRLPMGRTTTIEVSPVTYRTDTALRSLTPGRRQCFFQNERRLEYYALYTDSNCKHDLIIREAKRVCHCVRFNWPRKLYNEAICSTERDFRCIVEVEAKVEEQLIYAYFADSEENHNTKAGATSCYPSCNDILYTTQVYYSDLKLETAMVEERLIYEYYADSGENRNIKASSTSCYPSCNSIHYRSGQVYYSDIKPKGNAEDNEITKINVHFYDDMFIGLHRHAQYDEYYFAGAIGGLLSLFLGFSIISVAELIYFVMLRPLYIVLRYQIFGAMPQR